MTIEHHSHQILAAAKPLHHRRNVLAALAATSVAPAMAQFRVEVTGVGLTQLPIAIAPFRGDAQAPRRLLQLFRQTWSAVVSFAPSMLRALRWTNRRARRGNVAAKAPILWLPAVSPGWPMAGMTCASGSGTWFGVRIWVGKALS